MAADSASALTGYSGWVVVIAVGSLIILSGLVIILGRYWLGGYKVARSSQGADDGARGAGRTRAQLPPAPTAADSTLVRSWIAIVLVAGLLIFCAVALAINDAQLRSTLFGGLVASVGAAVAFYFSSKGADQARQDILSAALGTVEVPNLVDLSVSAARAVMSKTPLKLALANAQPPDTDEVNTQSPDAGTEVRVGSKVTIVTGAPVAGVPTAAGPTPTGGPPTE
jgi:hypothetical protein